jgi:hypothetical protein
MPIPHIEKHLAAIETILATDFEGCYVCVDWNTFVIYYQELDGSISGYDGEWPTDTFACPNCERQPKPLICISIDPRGPD